MFDFVSRLDRLHGLMDKEQLSAYLVTHPTDLYYLTGQSLSKGTLVLTNTSSVLIVDGRYFEACRNNCIIPVLLEGQNSVFSVFSDHKVLGIDSEHTSIEEFQALEAEAKKHRTMVKPVKSLVKLLRVFKDAEEIDHLRQAADLGAKGYEHARALMKEGISESDLAFEIELFWRKKGAQGVAFPPIIAFGENSSMPHYRAQKALLTQNMPILIDIGVTLNHYHSDMTRVIFYGKVDPELVVIRDVVEEAAERVFKVLKPGVSIGEVDAVGRFYIASKGYGDYFTHSMGHGIGLEVHEFPTLKQNASYAKILLQEGMVFTVEPGIYLPGIGGVRLEDTVVITAQGYENLTNRPKI